MAISGGFEGVNQDDTLVEASLPFGGDGDFRPDGWLVQVVNNGFSESVQLRAVCADLPPTR